MLRCVVFFFFKQKTAYEMRISDWSSDVCSSDLCNAVEGVSEGVVGAVVYAIHGDDFDGRPVHVGDTYSAEAAREVVQRLSFETSYYSRCWEISSAHISRETGQYLANLAEIGRAHV